MTQADISPAVNARRGLGRPDLPRSTPKRSSSATLLSPAAPVIRVLEAVNTLSEDERTLIGRLSVYRESIQAGQSFCRPGRHVTARILISGWACRQRTLPDGRRQIFGFLIPGDSVGLGPGSCSLDEVSTVAVTRVECMDALMLREMLFLGDERHRRLSQAVVGRRRLEEGWLLDHVVRLGRQSALERTAHFLLEIRDRTKAAGITNGEKFPMPLTQEVLSDALGLSVVHLNRTLQQMKKDGLVEMKSGWVGIVDLPYLRSIADFGPHDD